jgi:hypothetical protein
MFIAARLISRSSVSLSASIGYAGMGGGRAGSARSRGPDDARYRPTCRSLHPPFSSRFPSSPDFPPRCLGHGRWMGGACSDFSKLG